MKALSTLLALLLSGNGCFAERVIFTGFDLSGTAWRGEGNPYDNGLKEVLSTVEGGDHVYGAVINERGLAKGAPVIDFGIRPYSFWSDKRNEYEPAVQTKLKMQREALNNVLKSSTPSKKTEIIGFLHSAAQILNGYPAKTVKQIVIWTDGLQEGDEVDLARIVITDEQISKIIETERGAGRLPKLNGVAIWFVTSPSVESTQFTTSKLLRLEAFWRKYLQACGADLKAFSTVLVNFGGHMAMGSDAPALRRSKSPPFNKGATMHIGLKRWNCCASIAQVTVSLSKTHSTDRSSQARRAAAKPLVAPLIFTPVFLPSALEDSSFVRRGRTPVTMDASLLAGRETET